jgi:HEAT repeat protein
VWYLAQGTWCCDVSTAKLGEAALFFFEKSENYPEVQEATGSETLMRDSWSGHGRMPISLFGGEEYIEVDAHIVRLPIGLPDIPGDNPRCADWVRRVPKGAMLAEIRRRLGAKAPNVSDEGSEVIRIMCDLHCTSDSEGKEAEEMTDALEDRAKTAVPVLLGILDDAASPWREAAAEALMRIDDAGPEALKRGLMSEIPSRRRAAAYAIEWTVVSWQNFTMDSLPVIVEGLSSADPVVRAQLMGALSEHDEDAAFARLALGLKDGSLDVRIAAAKSLMKLHHYTWMLEDGPGIEPTEKDLLALAVSKEIRARRAAFEALQYLAGPASEATVLAALDDEDRIVRVTASLSLGRIGTPEALKALIALFGSKDVWARRAAAYALENGPCEAGVAILIKALEDPDEEVARLAIFALGEIGPAAAAAIPALEKIGSASAREALEKIRSE